MLQCAGHQPLLRLCALLISRPESSPEPLITARLLLLLLLECCFSSSSPLICCCQLLL
jgi:hypothetical protein